MGDPQRPNAFSCHAFGNLSICLPRIRRRSIRADIAGWAHHARGSWGLSAERLRAWHLVSRRKSGSPTQGFDILMIVRDEYRRFPDCAVVSALRVIWRAERFHSVSVTLAIRDHTFEGILGIWTVVHAALHTRGQTIHGVKKKKEKIKETARTPAPPTGPPANRGTLRTASGMESIPRLMRGLPTYGPQKGKQEGGAEDGPSGHGRDACK